MSAWEDYVEKREQYWRWRNQQLASLQTYSQQFVFKTDRLPNLADKHRCSWCGSVCAAQVCSQCGGPQ